jgi:SAM-dependent methyltransferase
MEDMRDWTKTFAQDLWLKPDDVGVEEALFIRKALRLHKGSRVLDAPCGAGRITIHLARSGCRVTGIDLRHEFIRRAQERFRNEGMQGRFMPADLREMRFKNEFDGVYCWLGSFGYFPDTENISVLQRYADALRQGGRLLVDQPNRESVLKHFIHSQTSGNLRTVNRWNPRTERLTADWIVDRGGQEEHNRMSIRLYTPGQMKALFQAVGLTVETLYGSKTGEQYKRGSKRLIVVGRK